MLSNFFDIEFYKRTGHALLACVTLLYLTVAYVAGVEVNMSIFADLTLIAGSLVLLPRIKISPIEESIRFDRNIFGYFFLFIIVFVAICDSHKLITLSEDKVEFFTIISQICMVLFGVSKFELSRQTIESVKDAFNWKRGYGSMMSNYYSGISNGYDDTPVDTTVAEQDLKKEVKKIAPPTKQATIQGNLLAAMQAYRGMCEVEGPQHNMKLIGLAKKAGFEWYVRDEIPWCAVMLNICCMIAGVPGTKSAMAKSFLKWGRPVTLDEARLNIGKVIAVFHRGSTSNDPEGHVTVVEQISDDGKWMIGIGGNQSNCVKSAKMALDNWRFIGFRML